MRKCRIGKRMANYYRNYANMFEAMSLLDIVSWTVGITAMGVAVGCVLGKIVEYTSEKLMIGDNLVTKDPDAEKPADNDE